MHLIDDDDFPEMDLDPILGTKQLEMARVMEAGALAELVLVGDLDWSNAGDATAAELRQLAVEGARARTYFIQANLRLVAQFAGRAARASQVSRADLFQEGCLGLLTAVDRFDWTKGLRFSTYAMHWIRYHVTIASAHGEHWNLSSSRAKEIREFRAIESDLTQTLGRTPTTADLAEVLSRGLRETEELRSNHYLTPLDLVPDEVLAVEQAEDNAASTFEDFYPAGTGLSDALADLEPLQLEVITLRYLQPGGEIPISEVARMLGIHRGRIRRAEQAVLAHLRGICRSGGQILLSA